MFIRYEVEENHCTLEVNHCSGSSEPISNATTLQAFVKLLNFMTQRNRSNGSFCVDVANPKSTAALFGLFLNVPSTSRCFSPGAASGPLYFSSVTMRSITA